MQIDHLRTNHLSNPLGYGMDKPVFSWVVSESTGKKQKAARIRVAKDADMTGILFDTGEREDLSSLGVSADVNLLPRTRYYWQVSVTADNGDQGTSEIAWFETGKKEEAWYGQWIRAPFDEHPVLIRSFFVDRSIREARLYICGLGLYEAFLNGEKIGDEYLAPGYDSYQYRIQYQTYDVTEQIAKGDNTISVMLGNGWYKGRYGLAEKMTSVIYGDRMQLIAELHIHYEDDDSEVIITDESWKCTCSPVIDSGLYDGEIYDARIGSDSKLIYENVLQADAPQGRLIDRIGLPVKVMKSWTEYSLLHTPSGELVLDFGQNLAGWVTFKCSIPFGNKVKLYFGELLQDDCFYIGNLRSAKAEYTFISDGKAQFVRPHFTYYGFRYVKVEGLSEEQIKEADFRICAIWTSLDATGTIETSDEKINRLIQNTLWSQRSNFVDIPTDCPQRDERLGWTGDAQAFSETACYNMYAPVFYEKYLSDMRYEQEELGGSVPFVVPDVLRLRNETLMGGIQNPDGSCAWGDAATVIPWNLYRFYGDKELLARTYDNMRLWTDYIRNEDEEKCKGSRIWASGFHFADWLSLDNPDKNSPMGGTDAAYVATCYYYLSSLLTAKAAAVLGKDEDAACYGKLADEIKTAFQKEYISDSGRLKENTQTSHILALHLGLVPEKHRLAVAENLRMLLKENEDHLTTGFVGTYQLCPTLTENGMTDIAYKLLFNEEFPGWLYEINHGATTIWERWNSVLPDGHVSDTGMNSMNHYCYGSIVQWIYQTVAGIMPDDSAPGFKKAVIFPRLDTRLSCVDCSYDAAAGTYHVRWERIPNEDKEVIRYTVTIPFDAAANIVLKDGTEKNLEAGTYIFDV